MRVLNLYTNFYGKRFAENLGKNSPNSWETFGYLFDRKIPAVIDEPEEFLPADLPKADLLVYVGQDRKLAELIPDIAQLCQAKEVIAAVDARAYMPIGLANQIKRRLTRMSIQSTFPAPFCSLTESQAEGPLTREFASHYGQARMLVTIKDGLIMQVDLLRGAPCGNSLYVAQRLPGIKVEESVEKAGLLFHAHPCMASMDMDRELGDTILHIAGHLVKNAVKEAVENADTGNATSAVDGRTSHAHAIS
jgi:thymidylate synthase